MKSVNRAVIIGDRVDPETGYDYTQQNNLHVSKSATPTDQPPASCLFSVRHPGEKKTKYGMSFMNGLP